ncbi:glutamate--tRNA ligase [Hirschia maritima]|uniref:glutamate--tRNA ligase n=1 Tax=Hirschia maritima TaxID=1121961 RepID=UPI000375BFE0|nr:glutamate--tRNA ligase [Hirschia maritima]
MTVKVRFAPSPTGRLHVGNVRTALINWLFAKGQGGQFVLRIDDTDLERSTKEYEDGIKEDLSWLGLEWDDTFKQSDRFAEYDKATEKLKADGLLYACYETSEELDRKRKIALSRGRPPVYDRAGLNLTEEEKAAFEAEGRKPHWRFKLSGNPCEWTDLVRGPQSIDTSSISDPVLIRADGSYLYTLPSVVDDIDANITHVVRGEDHVTNSGAQIEIFKALGGTTPQMAHTPLLIGADGQGLSKRLGSLSIQQLGQDGIEPVAIASLLAKIGTSDAVELRDDLQTLASEFSFDKIGRAPARFDEKELLGLNAEITHGLSFEDVKTRLEELPMGDQANEAFWTLVSENLQKVSEAAIWLPVFFGDISKPELEGDDASFIAGAAAHLPEGEVTEDTWKEWTNALKEATGRKGKQLFMPLRLALTGQSHGPQMNKVIALLGREKLLARLS